MINSLIRLCTVTCVIWLSFSLVCADHDIVHGYENQINCITIGKQPHQSLYFTFGLFQPQALLKGTPVCGLRKNQCFQSGLNTCRTYFKVESKVTNDSAAHCSMFKNYL